MNSSIKSFIYCLVVLLVLCQCGGKDDAIDPASQAATDKKLIEQHLSDNKITATEESSGIFYSTVTENPTGKTQAEGKILSIYYTAKILGGSTYAVHTRNEGDSVKLKQGIGAVYPTGLDMGLALMKEGEKFIFYIPSALAYGDYSFSTLIPKHAVLEIEVELTAIQDEADILTQQLEHIDAYIISENLNNTTIQPLDSVKFLTAEQMYYKRVAAGTANTKLQTGELATISYTATTLDKKAIDIKSGAGALSYPFSTNAVVSGLDAGVSQMERGETALIILPSHKAYGASVFVVPDYRKQDFVDLEIIPQYAAKVAPYEIVLFETSLLNNP